MYKGIQVYKGTTLAEKVAILPSQVRMKIDFMMKRQDHESINSASIILVDLCGVLLGLRRSGTLHRQKENLIVPHCFAFATCLVQHGT